MTTTATVATTETRTCARHGSYEASLMESGKPSLPAWLRRRWTSCPTCDAAVQAEADARDAEIRGGMTTAKAMAAARLRAAGIPARYAEATVWTWTATMDAQRAVIGTVRDYCRDIATVVQTGRSLVMTGGVGTGKTHLLAGIVRHAIEKGGTALYSTAADMVGRIRATYHRDADETEQQAIDALATCDVLAIDEVGRQLDTTHEATQLFRVLDRRYREKKPVVLASNLGRADLAKFLGDAIVDRLREGGGQVLAMDWASSRSTKRRVEADA